MKNILIFGSGFHAKVVFFEILKLKKYNIIGFVDPQKKNNEVILKLKKKEYKILDLRYFNKIFFYGIIAVGDNYRRKLIANHVENKFPNISWATIISKDAIVASNVKIGLGSVIISGSVINSSTIISNHVLINTSCSIDHDNFFGNFSSTSPGVITGGNVYVGKNSFIGISSTVKNNITIEDNVIIGACSYVNKNCKSSGIFYGHPVKFIKKIKTVKNYL
jgi:sugar O-acyltransferase (sialic acid O-acetyltransferase NeuD family)